MIEFDSEAKEGNQILSLPLSLIHSFFSLALNSRVETFDAWQRVNGSENRVSAPPAVMIIPSAGRIRLDASSFPGWKAASVIGIAPGPIQGKLHSFGAYVISCTARILSHPKCSFSVFQL